MPIKDHLNNEVALSVAVTPDGLSAKSKGRFLAAVDRLAGNLVDQMNAPLERRTAVKRAETEVNVEYVEALGRELITRLKDKAFAERALKQHLGHILREQENKDAVISKTVEQLRLSPPSVEPPDAPEVISEEFMSRFEGYARTAGTEELRAKWAGVLATEIRAPGTISSKVMRVVDEVDAATARLFQELCKHSAGNMVPIPLCGGLNFTEIKMLSDSGLIYDPGITGHLRVGSKAETKGGQEVWIWGVGTAAIGIIPRTTGLALPDIVDTIQNAEGSPGLCIYLLTRAGEAISSIFPPNDNERAQRLKEHLSSVLPDCAVVRYVEIAGELQEA